MEKWPTPESYRRFPGGDALPDTMKVWRIQKTGKTYGGVVSRSWGYNDSPDAEVLTAGYNEGKEHGAVGVGRHGNMLQWGFSAPPSKMTEAGRRFFVNAICYIHKYDGMKPLVRTEMSDRINPVRLALLLGQVTDRDFVDHIIRTVGQDVYDQCGGDGKKIADYLQENYEFLYPEGQHYRVDAEAKALDLKSNRTVESLESLVKMLNDPQRAAQAKILLARYTTESFATPAEWAAWFEASRSRVFFSDRGGFKFRVIPEDYITKPSWRALSQ